MRPLIAVTTSLAPGGDGRPERATLNAAYLDALQASGAAPVLLTPQMDQESLLGLAGAVRGLVLTGGGDVYPALYGEDAHERTAGVSVARDRMEIEALGLSLERNLPVLAICRGMQILNVALGGSLFQDLPDQHHSDINHAQTGGGETRDAVTHAVTVEAGSCLASVLGATELMVNSMHHQSIRRVGDGLKATAVAPDGVVEGVEMPAERWVVGVQWHPEELFAAHEHARRLFEAFLAAAH